jgi:hypothetical protein
MNRQLRYVNNSILCGEDGLAQCIFPLLIYFSWITSLAHNNYDGTLSNSSILMNHSHQVQRFMSSYNSGVPIL